MSNLSRAMQTKNLMALADVFLLLILLLIVLSAVLGVIGVVRRWYRSSEEKYSVLVGPRDQSKEPSRQSRPRMKRGDPSVRLDAQTRSAATSPRISRPVPKMSVNLEPSSQSSRRS